MRKYRDKLHDLQAAVKLTERKMREEDHSLSAKFGLMALKFSGLNKLFQDYDPITGEALSWSERLFEKSPLTASYDGAFGEVFPYLQHALDPQVIQSRMKETYESVVLDPLSKTTAYLDEVRQDVSHSVVRYSSYVDRWWGETRQKVDEARNTARSFLGDVVKGVQVGSGNAVEDAIDGFKELDALAEKAFGPNLALYRDEEDLPELLFKSLETINFYKNIFDDPKGNVQKVLDVPKYMWQGFKETLDRDFMNGDAESRTEFITYGLTSLGIGAIGDKGLGKIGTTAKTIDDVADAAKSVKVDGKGAQPALAGASAGGTSVSKSGAPYNVWNDPVSRIKTEIDRVYGGKGSSRKFSGYNYWDKTIEFNHIKVYQRDDIINPNKKDARGRTNLDRMKKGLAPLVPDGKSINLHHTTQRNESSIAEVTSTFHKENSLVIHINPNKIPSGINRKEFNKWRSEYWKNRYNDYIFGSES
ncbi:HNH/ENDO VII family nuclease [Guptibacillus hwajinpoensis]|uniref:HNH/ENDO VII family nuclease n=1 Tax=Guptibacillus hwajinpoensis TaxID=208199 RepID=UPI00273D5CF1|nr:HNH/ENDO VII family nuclease [Pseudalkalibacillus hwajinpoensis]WLR59139.1 HNH/ENDO VII family nuclease [Pseudalkalibacillus hwajinpoensis]